MKNLSHQHVCRLYHVIETSTQIFMVLEVSAHAQKLSMSVNMMLFSSFSLHPLSLCHFFSLSVLYRWGVVWLHHSKGPSVWGGDQSVLQTDCVCDGLCPQPGIRTQRPQTGKNNYLIECEQVTRNDVSARPWNIVHVNCNVCCNVCLSDLKENLLIDEDHNLKLIDFGLCAKPKVHHHISHFSLCSNKKGRKIHTHFLG